MLCSGPKRGRQLADLGQPAEPVSGADGAPLGVLQQAVEGGDLIESRRAAERRRELDCCRLAATHRHHEVRREGADGGARAP